MKNLNETMKLNVAGTRCDIVSIDFKKDRCVAVFNGKNRRFDLSNEDDDFEVFIDEPTMFKDKNGKVIWTRDIVSVTYKIHNKQPIIDEIAGSIVITNSEDYKLQYYIAEVVRMQDDERIIGLSTVEWFDKDSDNYDLNEESIFDLPHDAELEIIGIMPTDMHLLY
jgi:hypothetical protein